MYRVAPSGAWVTVKESGMNNKRVRGNKEAKKPKQERPAVPPLAGATNVPTLVGWQKPHQVKK